MGIFFKSSMITPSEVLAGDSVEFVIRLEAGEDYIFDKPSMIAFEFGAPLGTSCPTRDVNECSGYVEAYCSSPIVTWEIKIWDFDFKYFIDNNNKASREAARMVVLEMSPGIKPGDIIELHWGETLGGFGPGTKVTTVVPKKGWSAYVDIRYFDNNVLEPDMGRDFEGYTRPVPKSIKRLRYKVIPREVSKFRLFRKISTSTLVPYDKFWNIADVKNLPDLIVSSSKGIKNKQGTFDFKDKNVRITCKNHPIMETPPMENAFQGMNIYWGDLHTHSKFSCDCEQRSGMDMSPEDLMDFARYRAMLDFFAVTDHHVPHFGADRLLGEEKWNATMNGIREKHEEGKFVIIPGFEFTDDYGDICLYFKELYPYLQISLFEAKNVSDFYSIFGDNMLAVAHLHSPGIRKFGEWREGINPISPVIELYSDHGSFEHPHVCENGRANYRVLREDRCASYFIKQGCRYGFAANSDDHKGHAGINGLTAVFAENLSREAIWDAYCKRRVYATTNARIRLLFTGNQQLMGSEIKDWTRKELHIDVCGEESLKKVELFRNGNFHEMFIPSGKNFKTDYICNTSEPDSWYVRVTQMNNHIAWSSPVWFY